MIASSQWAMLNLIIALALSAVTLQKKRASEPGLLPSTQLTPSQTATDKPSAVSEMGHL